MEATKDVLFKFYVEEGKTTTEIAEILGYKTAKSIADKLKKFNIPIRQKNKDSERVGERNLNSYGSGMEVIEYNNAHDIIVRFNNGYTTKAEYKAFKKGSIKSPYCKSVFTHGFIGEGKFKAYHEDGSQTIEYQAWTGLMGRAYGEYSNIHFPSYKDVTVAEEWHNFQIFSQWFNANYYTIDGQTMHVEKDILVKGNKVYSPDRCIIAPHCINNLFPSCKVRRGSLPIGVRLHEQTGTYQAYCKNGNNKVKSLGYHNTPEEAFMVYKVYKEKLIKQIAEEFKDKIPEKLYNALYNYIVEITD